MDLGASDIHVVDTGGERFNDLVSAMAAEIAMELIVALARKSIDPIGVGLGPGKATLDFSRFLSELLNRSTEPALRTKPLLKLFAITAGCLPKLPEFAPVSFFNLFPGRVVKERVGLFAETAVTAREFAKIRRRPGIAEAFAEKPEINIVVTAMGDLRDPHDLLPQFLNKSKDELSKAGVWGNVQYRPFSSDRFIQERPDELRVVTLFELDELVAMSKQRDRDVILIARQCGRCGLTRARVLRPLLQIDELRVFSKLVMDVPTARELLNDAAEPTTAVQGPSAPSRPRRRTRA